MADANAFGNGAKLHGSTEESSSEAVPRLSKENDSSSNCHGKELNQTKDSNRLNPEGTKLIARPKGFSELPDPSVGKVSPDDFLLQLVKAQWGITLESKPALSLEGFFSKITDDQMEAYSMQVVSLVRNNDLPALKKLQEETGQRLDCFNRFGESLLNLSCRRGFEDIVQYLLEQPEVNVRISDDCGRTPLHDCCWHPQPQLRICQLLLERDPTLFLISDKRGCTPFDYARPEHWAVWRKFLFESRAHLEPLVEAANRTLFSKE